MESLIAVLAVLLMHVPLGFFTCCCGSCILCDGDGCTWTTVSGSGVTSGVGFVDFTSSNAIVLTDATSPTGTTAVRVEASVYGQSNGDQARLLFKYKDTANYWFVQIEWASGANNAAVKLFKRVSNSNTQLAAFGLTAEADNAVFLTVCYGENVIKVTETVSGKSVKLWTPTTVNDADSAGVAVATVGGGSLVEFTSFKYEKAKAAGTEDCVSCLGCDVAFDDFTRSNDTDISVNSPAGWTENSGSWEIASNALKATASGDVTFGAAQPVGSKAMIVRVTANISNSSSYADVKIAETDSTHYYYARFKPSDGTAQVRYNNGGSHVDLCPAVSAGVTTGNQNLAVCVTESGHVTAYCHATNPATDAPRCTAFAVNNVYSFGDKCGLAATIASGGNVVFDNFALSQTQNSDFALTCETCAFGGCADIFCNLDVDFSGMNHQNDYCADCTTLNAIFSLPRRQSTAAWASVSCGTGVSGPPSCIWALEFPGCANRGTNKYVIAAGIVNGGTPTTQRLNVLFYFDLVAGGGASCGASAESVQTGVTDSTFDDTGATTYTFQDIPLHSWAAPPRSGVPCLSNGVGSFSATASPII